ETLVLVAVVRVGQEQGRDRVGPRLGDAPRAGTADRQIGSAPGDAHGIEEGANDRGDAGLGVGAADGLVLAFAGLVDDLPAAKGSRRATKEFDQERVDGTRSLAGAG